MLTIGRKITILALLTILAVPCSAANKSGCVTLAAVGDVLFARGVGRQIAKHGADWPFQNVKSIISSADLAFCNLECTLSTGGVCQRRRYYFRANPAFAKSLRSNGFNMVSLANNHTLDYGRDALLDTISAVRKSGLTAAGAGSNRIEALKLQIIKRNGLKMGFLAYTDLPSDGVVRLPEKPTVAAVDPDELPSQIKAAKRRCDVLIVSFHWGVEYMKKPTERQREIAHLCIRNGADLILGHHPHVLQNVEVYKGKPIAYSMGGFIWDAKIFGADHAAIYVFSLKKDTAKLIKTIPVQSIHCRPTLVGNKK